MQPRDQLSDVLLHASGDVATRAYQIATIISQNTEQFSPAEQSVVPLLLTAMQALEATLINHGLAISAGTGQRLAAERN